MSTTTQTKTKQHVHIRWMIRRDMPEVLAIEADNYVLMGYPFAPWDEDDFIRCLRQRNCIGMTAEVDDKVAGFMVYELHESRLHILNLAVDPVRQRQGIGAEMTTKLIRKLSPQRRTRILMEISEHNLDGQLFLSRQGFRAINVLREWYDDPKYGDAYLFQYRLAG